LKLKKANSPLALFLSFLGNSQIGQVRHSFEFALKIPNRDLALDQAGKE
jgi:hypothetical protein